MLCLENCSIGWNGSCHRSARALQTVMAWMAEWGKGKPVIALGSDIDGIPKSSQMPGVAYHKPIIEGAPGHGEGHNSVKR